ncbi:PQQ-like beta-propeller repeat protein [Parapedobacter lycopersici]|uniref:PQQ-like beta-propeller repeat protein n=1 Tax=Parapedobacter lycopersici TaxID=1864939 RepID=UPI00214D6776|nr:PQQ-like beta-propeller repeat protein [Parapedobacter lycopersici]
MKKAIQYLSIFLAATCYVGHSFGQAIAPNPAPKSDKPDYSNNQVFTAEDMYVETFHEYLIYNKTVGPRWIINRYDGVLECYNTDFQKLWSFTPTDTERLNNGRNQFYYQDGVLFTAYMTGYIYAINATDGSLFWESKIGLNTGELVLRGQSLVPYRDMLFLSSNNSNIYAISASDGQLQWNYKLVYPYNNLPNLVLNDTLYLQNAPYVYNFVAASGQPLYQRGFPRAMYGKPVTDGHLVIIPNESKTVYGLAPADLAPVWEFEIGEDEYNINKKIFTAGDKVYFATETDGSHSGVYCLVAADGQLQWKAAVEGDIEFIVQDGALIYGYTAENKLFTLTMDTGAVELSPLDYQPVSNLQIVNGDVYYYAKEGLVRFGRSDGGQQVVIPFDGKDADAAETRLDSQILLTTSSKNPA